MHPFDMIIDSHSASERSATNITNVSPCIGVLIRHMTRQGGKEFVADGTLFQFLFNQMPHARICPNQTRCGQFFITHRPIAIIGGGLFLKLLSAHPNVLHLEVLNIFPLIVVPAFHVPFNVYSRSEFGVLAYVAVEFFGIGGMCYAHVVFE